MKVLHRIARPSNRVDIRPSVHEWMGLFVLFASLPFFSMLNTYIFPSFNAEKVYVEAGLVWLMSVTLIGGDVLLRELIHRHPKQFFWKKMWDKRAFLMCAFFLIGCVLLIGFLNWLETVSAFPNSF